MKSRPIKLRSVFEPLYFDTQRDTLVFVNRKGGYWHGDKTNRTTLSLELILGMAHIKPISKETFIKLTIEYNGKIPDNNVLDNV